MAVTTSIEWADSTWNAVTGCTEVSPGCDSCYAKTFAERWRGTPGHHFEQGFDVILRPDKLRLPLSWRKPRRIFANSMSDLFHDTVPDEYIARVFAVMALTQRHTYQLLTKRHGRMRSWLNNDRMRLKVYNEAHAMAHQLPSFPDASVPWPLPNLWLGVSVEDQKRADLRIPALIDTPSAVRWLSCEPLLGPVDLDRTDKDALVDGGIGWVVVGGESGPKARPMQPDWARSLRDQCCDAGVPFFFKQWGGRTPKAGGRLLDGRTWDQYPATPDQTANAA
jgi:protein gp37